MEKMAKAVMHSACGSRLSISMMKAVVTLVWGLSVAGVTSLTHPIDVAALTAFRTAVGSSSTIVKSWKDGTDPCDNYWLGVSLCKPDASGMNRVTVLSLLSSNLAGQLPPQLGNLSALIELDLSLNEGLVGGLPLELVRLTNLQTLNLQRCKLSGSLPPEYGAMSSLQYFIVNDNSFTGSLPSAWSAMSNMVYFDVDNNQLGGSIPVSPGVNNWQNVRHLHLTNNHFTNFPAELGELPNLIHLLIDDNAISGQPIPPSVGNISTLQILKLSNNKFTGGMPPELGGLTSLRQLVLSNCSLAGDVPDLSSLVNLFVLDLSFNRLTGAFPPAIGRTVNTLQTISVAGNLLNGTLSPYLANLTSLQSLDADNNRFSSGVPDLSPIAGLALLSLANNDFTGAVPDALLGAADLALVLSGNPLCVFAQSAAMLGACQQQLDATQGAWVGPAICQDHRCPADQAPSPYLYLAGQGCRCATPLAVNIILLSPPYYNFTSARATQLRGILANKVAQQVNVTLNQVWIVSSNGTLGGRQLVEVQFFPPGEQAWSNVELVGLYNGMSLQSKQLGPSFGPYTVQYLQLVLQEMDEHESHLSGGAIAGIVVGAILAVTLVAILLIIFLMRRQAKCGAEHSQQFSSWNRGLAEVDLEGLNLQGVKYYTLEEIQKATDMFSTLLGEGGYGAVYKGEFEDGKVAAIKRAKPDSHQGGKEFRNEIELLSGVRHKNLVVLLGFCKERGEQLLAYEFIPHGNLYDRLHGKVAGAGPLTWKQRVSIALCSARGLAYLHYDINPPIIHRDVKTANILIDDKSGAKVADFGLSKMLAATELEHESASVETKVKGTLGYMDPEYFLTDRLTEKSDVYSFGIVLLELATGRRPIEKNEHIVRVVNAEMQMGGIGPLVDVSMGEYIPSALDRLVSLALRCVHQDPEKRPTMQQVCTHLEAIRDASGVPVTPDGSLGQSSHHGWGTPAFPSASTFGGTSVSGWTQSGNGTMNGGGGSGELEDQVAAMQGAESFAEQEDRMLEYSGYVKQSMVIPK